MELDKELKIPKNWSIRPDGTFEDHTWSYTHSIQLHCDGCKMDISGPTDHQIEKHDPNTYVRITCAVCYNSDATGAVDLCLPCFSKGVNVNNHRCTHPYRVQRPFIRPIFHEGWTVEDELTLLDAIQSKGFGNWSEICKSVAKTQTQCEEHYNAIYLANDECIPDIKNEHVLTESEFKELISEGGGIVTNPKKRHLSTGQKRKPFAASGFEQEWIPSLPKPKSGIGGVLGYIPNRDEFANEYDNEFESLLGELEFKDDEDAAEHEYKLHLLTIYNSKLDARLERKKLIFGHSLMQERNDPPNRSAIEEDVHESLKLFARFQPPKEHQRFVQGVAKELELKSRIDELQKYRRAGFLTLFDVQAAHLKGTKSTKSSPPSRANNSEPLSDDEPDLFDEITGDGCDLNSRKTSSTHFEPAEKTDKNMHLPSNGSSVIIQQSAVSRFVIELMPNAHMLSSMEKNFCQKWTLLPRHWFIIKYRLLKAYLARGYLTHDMARAVLPNIDLSLVNDVFNALLSFGYISTHERSCATSKHEQDDLLATVNPVTMPIYYSSYQNPPNLSIPGQR